MRTVGWRRILLRMQRAHPAVLDTSNTMDSLREIIPGYYALIAKVIHTRFNTLLNSREDDHCQITRIGRRTHLVEDHPQFWFLLTQSYHGLHEVVAEGRIEPRRTDDHRTLAELRNTQFASQFRRTIDAIRTRRVRLHIRGMLRAVEHIVCRDLDEPSSALVDSSGEIGRCQRVQRRTEFFVVLRLIHSRIGGTVHDTVNLIVSHKLFHSSLVRDIQLSHIRIKIGMLGIHLLQQLHLVS